MFKNPYLALCADRNNLPKSNQVTGSPEEWFSNNILNDFNLIGFSFDFFIDWSKQPYTLNNHIWVKKILTVSPNELISNGIFNEKEFISNLLDFEGLDYINSFAKFAKKNDFTLQYICFREIDWSTKPEPIIICTIEFSDELHYKFEFIQYEELKDRIRNYSGGPINIGSKGLIYGTSLLECNLSHTDSLYPGDADLVIVENETLNTLFIVEFKKHNLDSPINLQKLNNYYPRPDGRKYDRLAILLKNLKEKPRFICLYYPTKFNDRGWVELIEGEVGRLVTGKSGYIDLPIKNDLKAYSNLIKKIFGIK